MISALLDPTPPSPRRATKYSFLYWRSSRRERPKASKGKMPGGRPTTSEYYPTKAAKGRQSSKKQKEHLNGNPLN